MLHVELYLYLLVFISVISSVITVLFHFRYM